MLLLDFGQIRQYLTDVVDTVWVAVAYRNVDIGRVMLFKLTPVIPAFPVSDIAPVQTGLLRPRIGILSFTTIQPEYDMGMVVVVFGPFDNPEKTDNCFELHHTVHQFSDIPFELPVIPQEKLSGMILVKQICSECPQAGIALYHFVYMVVQEGFQEPVWLPSLIVLHSINFFSVGEDQQVECTRPSGGALAEEVAWVKEMTVKRECLLIILINLN